MHDFGGDYMMCMVLCVCFSICEIYMMECYMICIFKDICCFLYDLMLWIYDVCFMLMYDVIYGWMHII